MKPRPRLMACARSPVRVGAAGILLGLLACRPIFVIGWGELAVLILLIALLLGPILFRFLRTWDAARASRKKKRD